MKNKIDYRFDEEKYITEFKEYVDATYNQHYSQYESEYESESESSESDLEQQDPHDFN